MTNEERCIRFETALDIVRNVYSDYCKDESLYKQIADIELHSMVHLYGGENVRIYKSTQDNEHYIYWRYCWGD